MGYVGKNPKFKSVTLEEFTSLTEARLSPNRAGRIVRVGGEYYKDTGTELVLLSNDGSLNLWGTVRAGIQNEDDWTVTGDCSVSVSATEGRPTGSFQITMGKTGDYAEVDLEIPVFAVDALNNLMRLNSYNPLEGIGVSVIDVDNAVSVVDLKALEENQDTIGANTFGPQNFSVDRFNKVTKTATVKVRFTALVDLDLPFWLDSIQFESNLEYPTSNFVEKYNYLAKINDDQSTNTVIVGEDDNEWFTKSSGSGNFGPTYNGIFYTFKKSCSIRFYGSHTRSGSGARVQLFAFLNSTRIDVTASHSSAVALSGAKVSGDIDVVAGDVLEIVNTEEAGTFYDSYINIIPYVNHQGVQVADKLVNNADETWLNIDGSNGEVTASRFGEADANTTNDGIGSVRNSAGNFTINYSSMGCINPASVKITLTDSLNGSANDGKWWVQNLTNETFDVIIRDVGGFIDKDFTVHISKNFPDAKNKEVIYADASNWMEPQVKYLSSGSITATGDVTDLTVTDLVIGESYMCIPNIYSTDIQDLYFRSEESNGGDVYNRHYNNNSGTQTQMVGSPFIFTAKTANLYVYKGNTGSLTGTGSKTATWLQVIKLPSAPITQSAQHNYISDGVERKTNDFLNGKRIYERTLYISSHGELLNLGVSHGITPLGVKFISGDDWYLEYAGSATGTGTRAGIYFDVATGILATDVQTWSLVGSTFTFRYTK